MRRAALLPGPTAVELRSADFSPLPHGTRKCAGSGMNSALQVRSNSLNSMAVHPGPLPSNGRGRIVLSPSAYPTALEAARDPSGCSLSRQTGEGQGEGRFVRNALPIRQLFLHKPSGYFLTLGLREQNQRDSQPCPITKHPECRFVE